MSATDTPGPEAPPATPRRAGGPDGTHHWWRLIAIWVVLSAILDPLY